MADARIGWCRASPVDECVHDSGCPSDEQGSSEAADQSRNAAHRHGDQKRRDDEDDAADGAIDANEPGHGKPDGRSDEADTAGHYDSEHDKGRLVTRRERDHDAVHDRCSCADGGNGDDGHP